MSSKQFVLTSVYLDINLWQDTFNSIRTFRRKMKEKYGLHVSEEIHTNHLVRDKGLYRAYGWSDEERRGLLIDLTKHISCLEVIMSKESTESYFIQTCDYVSFFADLYHRVADKNEKLPKRVERIVDESFYQTGDGNLSGGILNLKASSMHPYGFVIYPK